MQGCLDGLLKKSHVRGLFIQIVYHQNLLCILQEHGDMWDVALCLKSEHNEAK